MNDLISVIVPIFNVENYLSDCLNSIKNQSYENLEIILVDDGSTDKSGKIADKFAADDDRFRVIHTSNGGSCVARNIDLDNCSGNFIAFVDSDDTVDVNYIYSLYDALKLTQSDISVCDFNHSPNIIPQIFNDYEILHALIWNDTPPVNHKICGYIFNKLYSRKVVDNVKFPSSEGGSYQT